VGVNQCRLAGSILSHKSQTNTKIFFKILSAALLFRLTWKEKKY